MCRGAVGLSLLLERPMRAGKSFLRLKDYVATHSSRHMLTCQAMHCSAGFRSVGAMGGGHKLARSLYETDPEIDLEIEVLSETKQCCPFRPPPVWYGPAVVVLALKCLSKAVCTM